MSNLSTIEQREVLSLAYTLSLMILSEMARLPETADVYELRRRADNQEAILATQMRLSALRTR